MKWISSYGGPYICTDRATAEKWLGIQGLSIKTDVAVESDYVLACQMDNYAGLLSNSVANVLVIGDLPEEMTWISLGVGHGIFIKWGGADSEEQVRLAIDEIRRQKFVDLGFKYTVNGHPLIVFDSAPRLRDTEENHIELDLPIGVYSVSVCEYEPDDSLSLTAIRLSYCGSEETSKFNN